MQAKLSEDQFDQVTQLSYPTYLLKATPLCVETCAIDLCSEDTAGSPFAVAPRAKPAEDLLYLSDREAVCVEACTRLYLG